VDQIPFSGVVSLFDRGREVETRCELFADIPNKRPNGPATAFGMASGSKAFTAACILSLAEEDALSLGDSADRLAGGGIVDPAITVLQLLTHTSGVADYADEEEGDDYEALWRDRPNYSMRKPADFLPLFAGKAPKFAPGARFGYSNSGFVLLACIIERITRHSFPQAVRERVLAPCGMGRTDYWRLDMPPPDAAIGYVPEDGAMRSNAYSIPIVGGGDGGCFANGADMDRFWRALAEGRPLGKAIADDMLSVHVGDTGDEKDRYGLGVWIDERDDDIAFVQGFDPGVRFLSYYHRRSGKSLMICANTECRLGPVVAEYKPRLA
jgi:D-alanyl-D-alanine carboxypeptidase